MAQDHFAGALFAGIGTAFGMGLSLFVAMVAAAAAFDPTDVIVLEAAQAAAGLIGIGSVLTGAFVGFVTARHTRTQSIGALAGGCAAVVGHFLIIVWVFAGLASMEAMMDVALEPGPGSAGPALLFLFPALMTGVIAGALSAPAMAARKKRPAAKAVASSSNPFGVSVKCSRCSHKFNHRPEDPAICPKCSFKNR